MEAHSVVVNENHECVLIIIDSFMIWSSQPTGQRQRMRYVLRTQLMSNTTLQYGTHKTCNLNLKAFIRWRWSWSTTRVQDAPGSGCMYRGAPYAYNRYFKDLCYIVALIGLWMLKTLMVIISAPPRTIDIMNREWGNEERESVIMLYSHTSTVSLWSSIAWCSYTLH